MDLKIHAAGVTNLSGAILDGEWANGVSSRISGNGLAGGDFSFRMFVLPGDVVDQSSGGDVRTVNTNDSQRLRDRQNGFALASLGAFGYDSRADLNGDAFINANDSQLERDQQNAIIFRNATPPPAAVESSYPPGNVDQVWSLAAELAAESDPWSGEDGELVQVGELPPGAVGADVSGNDPIDAVFAQESWQISSKKKTVRNLFR